VAGAFNSGLVGGGLWGIYNGSGVYWNVAGATLPSSPASGSINATKFYDDGTAICYPIEAAVTGDIDLSRWDVMMPADEDGNRKPHEMAAKFKQNKDLMLDVERYSDFWKQNMHLPGLPSREEWIDFGKLSLGDVLRRLWETVECQAVHIDQLLARIKRLEGGG